jgi:undecaprenyl-diphosphatase
MNRLKTFWQAAQVPLLGAVFILIIYYVWGLLDLPPREALIDVVRGLIERYGYIIVFLGAFVESLLLIGWYFPGSLIIFISVIFAPTPTAAVISVAIVTLALWCGYTFNFFLGRHGWYRVLVAFGIKQYLDEAKDKLTKYGIFAVFTSYWSPGLASFVSTAAGVLHYPAYKFLSYSLIAVVIWNIFWGTLIYTLGERALTLVLSWPFMVFVIVLWIGVRFWNEKKSSALSL